MKKSIIAFLLVTFLLLVSPFNTFADEGDISLPHGGKIIEILKER